jgi:(R,R)-butanediol dehydrogenase/meso-butanediol dehydrogenase/diacetyl reductase
VIEPSAQRAEVLRGLGVETVIDPAAEDPVVRLSTLTAGDGVDVSFDTAGVQNSFDAAVQGTRKQGTIMLVATYGAPVSLHPNELVLTERSVLSSCAYRSEDFDAVIATIAAGGYPTDGWVSVIALDDLVEKGFAALHDQSAMKVLVDVRA